MLALSWLKQGFAPRRCGRSHWSKAGFCSRILAIATAPLAGSTLAATAFYQKAFDALVCQISLPCERTDIPVYDAERLKAELEVFPEWFLSACWRQPDELGASALRRSPMI